MKQSFTYSGEAKTRKDAARRAKKEGMRFSELVERLLKSYYLAEPQTLDGKQVTTIIILK